MSPRLVSLFVAAALAATAATGVASQPRRDTERYTPADDNFYAMGPEEFIVGTGDSKARYEFEIRKGEKSVSVMILDDTERPVSGIVSQWQSQGGTGAGPASAEFEDAVTWERFCTRTTAPVKLKPKLPVRIMVMEGTCKDGTPSTPTTGEIVVDFHRG